MSKFSIKKLAAAALIAGASSSAFAGVQASNTAGQGGEMLFFAYDVTTKNSFVMDMGVSFVNFLSNPTFNTPQANNVSAYATEWNNYYTAEGNSMAGTIWGVAAIDNRTPTAMKMLVTASNPSVTGLAGSGFAAAATVLDSTWFASQGDGTAAGVNNAYFAPGSDTSAKNWAVSVGSNFAGKISPWIDTNAYSSSVQSLYQISRGTNPLGVATILDSTNGFQFTVDGSGNAALFTVSAVPEPGTWAMLMAGLMMVAGISRRRIS